MDNVCKTENEEKCSTVVDNVCETVNERKCSTVTEKQCEQVMKKQCSDVDDTKCESVPERKCEQKVEEVCTTACSFVSTDEALNSPVLGLDDLGPDLVRDDVLAELLLLGQAPAHTGQEDQQLGLHLD